MLTLPLTTTPAPHPHHTRTTPEEGFTLAELVVSATVIMIIMGVFSIFMANVAQDQRLTNERTAIARIAYSELNQLNSMPWNDLVSDNQAGTANFTGRIARCVPDTSNPPQETQASLTGTGIETVPLPVGSVGTSSGTAKNVRILRTITWADTTTTTYVTCANRNRSDALKKVTVTLQWNIEGGTTEAFTVAQYRSTYAAPTTFPRQ